MTYEEIAVSATIIKVGAPISPELTAVSPSTKAPTMLTACPKGLGSLSPASRIISYMKWISSTSVKTENGVCATEAATLFKIPPGNSSGLYPAIATYIPGVNTATKNARYFNILLKLAKYALLE